jgi:voltage-gated potassium channel
MTSQDTPDNSAVPQASDVRLGRAEALARRLDKPMGILGVIFLFVVLGQLVAKDPALVSAFTVMAGSSGPCSSSNSCSAPA